MIKLKSLALAGAVLLALAACGNKEEAAQAPAEVQAQAKELGPVDTLKATNDALKNNDLGKLLAMVMPADKLAEMRTDWDKERAKPVTDEDRQEFADGWGKLTKDGAVDELMAEAEPQLAQMGAQLPAMMPMFQGMVTMSVQESEELTAEQKAAACSVVTGLFTWAQSADLANPEKLRPALTIAHEKAKSLNLNSIDEVRAMDFDQMLGKASVMVGGVKEMLSVYGLSVDEMVSSMTAEQLEMSGDTAKVRTTYTLFGSPVTYDTEMVKMDGRWFSKDSMESLEKMTASSDDSMDEESDEAEVN